MKAPRTLLLVALMGLSWAASAQWQWVDKDGRKVFSDRPPPAGTPEKSIIRRGAGLPVMPPPGTDASGTAPTPAAKPAGNDKVDDKSAAVDKELEAKKKKAQDAEEAKRKAEEDRIAKARMENCERAKQAKATLDSGVRIARTNTKGEKEILDDAARAAELQRVNNAIKSDCK